ncbi:hypothetical protein HYH03_014106 [Edaphochlamys debaryana]|uniref:YkgJ family cysteine cluster protein n=1 Tax=Edaphochlamys debaryana TaxID=47281 RepID=A0A835XUT2_9CHLO|nr:hypothetical protein HYH03_014106 [Edaphochlamys debaryana]|eukprot:KAG2487265.1 hypothetical protein HYH03_014106 [Edaphochlamys debaryana]
MCGKCCTGPGEVWVSPEEVVKISAHLGCSPEHFLVNYCLPYSKYKGWRMLKTQPESEVDACIFLGADNKCSIHTVRPLQCSTYPWWPELTDDKDWAWEKTNVCEGFDHPEAGPLDVESAAQQLREATAMQEAREAASTVKVTPQVAAAAGAPLLILWLLAQVLAGAQG